MTFSKEDAHYSASSTITEAYNWPKIGSEHYLRTIHNKAIGSRTLASSDSAALECTVLIVATGILSQCSDEMLQFAILALS